MKKYFFAIPTLFFILTINSGCIKKSGNEQAESNFKIVRTIKLQIQEPSGLDLSFFNDGFWTVSDENSKVYRLDVNGNILHSFNVNGIDIEGVAVIDTNIIAVVLERSREILLLDTLGTEISRKKLKLKGDANSGLEGISYDKENKIFYVVNEKSPGLLIVLDNDLNEIERIKLDLAKDYSSVFYEENEDVLWILSDESQKIMIADKSGKLIEEYKSSIVQAEGIALDYKNNKIFVVSDYKEELYEIKITRSLNVKN